MFIRLSQAAAWLSLAGALALGGCEGGGTEQERQEQEEGVLEQEQEQMEEQEQQMLEEQEQQHGGEQPQGQ